MTIVNHQEQARSQGGQACICGDHVFASVGRGFVALVSPEDGHLLDKRWHTNVQGRYVTAQRTERDPKRTVSLARTILAPLPGLQVDHINRDTMDNRRHNLRVCTPVQNCWNRGHQKRDLPVGVAKVWRRYVARIRTKGKNVTLGVFDTPEDAHAAYVAAAMRLRGEFARVA